MEIELGEYLVVVRNVEHFGGTSADTRGHPDNWCEGEEATLEYDLTAVTRFGEDQDDVYVLSKEERDIWLGDHYEDLDAAILRELP